MKQQIRSTIADSISDFHMPRFEDIPGIGLYLEQTVSYICEYLSPILDMYNGEIVSYNISEHPVLGQVLDMLDKAFVKIPFFHSSLSLDFWLAVLE